MRVVDGQWSVVTYESVDSLLGYLLHEERTVGVEQLGVGFLQMRQSMCIVQFTVQFSLNVTLCTLCTLYIRVVFSGPHFGILKEALTCVSIASTAECSLFLRWPWTSL